MELDRLDRKGVQGKKDNVGLHGPKCEQGAGGPIGPVGP